MSNGLLKPERQCVVSSAHASPSAMVASSVASGALAGIVANDSQMPGSVAARTPGFVVSAARAPWLTEAMMANNALERAANHRGPRLAAAPAAWPAAQRDR
jgi:hypothetical protein